MWTWLLCTFVETQGTNPLRSPPPLYSGDSPCSICRNLLAELSLTALFYGERERGITKIVLLPGAAWFSFEGLLNIFLTFSLNLVFPPLLWLYLIRCSLGNVYLYTHMLWMLISSPCGKQYVPISLGPFPSGSLGVFPSIRLSQNPAEPLAHHLFSCGGIGRHRLWWCQTTWHGSLNPTYTELCAFSGHPGGSVVKNLPAVQEMQETWVWSLGQEDPLEKEMATHSSILAWRNPMDRRAWWAAVHGV